MGADWKGTHSCDRPRHMPFVVSLAATYEWGLIVGLGYGGTCSLVLCCSDNIRCNEDRGTVSMHHRFAYPGPLMQHGT